MFLAALKKGAIQHAHPYIQDIMTWFCYVSTDYRFCRIREILIFCFTLSMLGNFHVFIVVY